MKNQRIELKDCGVTFLEDEHRYFLGETELSGITKSLPFAQKVNQTGHVLNLKPKRKFDEYM